MEEQASDKPAKREDELSVSNVSVQMADSEDKWERIARKLNRTSKSKRKKNKSIWNFQNKIILFTVVLFIVGVITWTLLWLFIVQAESKDALYFVGLFRVANIEFLPEYRQKESREFLTVAQNVQQVMNLVYTKSAFAKFYKQSIVSDVSNNNNGGLLVHFWIVFVVPQAKGQVFCEDCVAAILKDSIQTSITNRTSIGSLQGLAVDMDSIVLSVGLRSDYSSTTGTGTNCIYDLHADRLHQHFPLDISAKSGRMICYFKLIALVGYLIRLSIASIQLEADNCITDSLTIYDSLMPIKSKILYRICEPTDSFLSFVSTNNMMLITMKSAQVRKVKEFHGYFEVIAQEKCGQTMVALGSTGFGGRIMSPYYPSHYPPKCICTWTFQIPQKDFGIALKFHNYTIREKSIKGCEHGWWKINEHMYCGYYIDHPTIFRVASFGVNIEFQCSSKLSEQPLLVEYGLYDISQPCPLGSFECHTGLCIQRYRRCDGINDCYDESDELFCDTSKQNCSTSFLMQHHSIFCDGINDCEDGQDEQHCTENIPCTNNTYKCSNNVCFRKQNARCDGIIDCLDRSDERNCSCGSTKYTNAHLRIVGGSDAQEGEWPWQVSLQFAGVAYCGASVISKEWLLSAAHCFQGNRLSDPRIWTAHMGMRIQGKAKFVSTLRRIIIHEYYNSQNYDYDIALLQLSTPWADTMRSLIQPICLPPATFRVYPGEKCWVTGWGQKQETDDEAPAVLQKAEVEIVDQTLCHSTYGLITARMLCAGMMSGKRDSCKGDSGGPLSCRSKGDGKWLLIGIVSWGYGCGRPNFPGVYTRVSNFATWIHKYVPSVF
ncbi:transmembrane protease serine 7-like [Sceloporus undulatus]|uniref:transmembrane protease serine 7-like n=1 Tax=Sceloporus undulatus TaxID=8520 RepID=UPI001C4CA4E1|nr:transmembrane protease serine 7-like [Sceloporus undulatus]XP_042298977.1 transmembrane protease serine 7-like [Sceloporus undulatus]